MKGLNDLFVFVTYHPYEEVRDFAYLLNGWSILGYGSYLIRFISNDNQWFNISSSFETNDHDK